MKLFKSSLLILSTLFFFACGGGAVEQTDDMSSEDMATEESHAGHDHAEMEKSTGTNELPAIPEGARVYFKNLKDGAEVSSPVHIEMGAEGITVHPAGEVMEGTGHHHILVNESATPSGTVVPADETHIHFGGGQTEFDLPLEPGSHQLTLQFADGIHRSYGEQLSATINITVK